MPPKRSTARRLRRVEVRVRVEPEHADPDRRARRAGVLQSGDEPRHRRTRREQPDREVAVALVLLDDVGEMA